MKLLRVLCLRALRPRALPAGVAFRGPSPYHGPDFSDDEEGFRVRFWALEHDLARLEAADEIVIREATVRILYGFPLLGSGPSPEEQENGGWLFTEAAPRRRGFTRADVARAVAARYAALAVETCHALADYKELELCGLRLVPAAQAYCLELAVDS